MKTLFRIVVLSVVLALAGTLACKKETKPAAPATPAPGEPAATPSEPTATDEATPTPRAIVDRGIAAAGGLEALRKSLSACTVETSGTYLGMPYESVTFWKAPDQIVTHMSDGSMSMGNTAEGCWNRYGTVVVDCSDDEAEASQAMLYATHVMNLYALAGDDVTLAKSDNIEIEGNPAVGVTVTTPDGPMPMTLYFDEETGRLVRSVFDGKTRIGRKGRYEITLGDFRKEGEITVPGRVVVTFAGAKMMEEVYGAMELGALEEAKLARPDQAPVGVVEVRPLPEHAVAFTTFQGPYDALGEAATKLFRWAIENQLAMTGPPYLVYLSGPDDVKGPENYVTEVRVPVFAPKVVPTPTDNFAVKTVPGCEIACQLQRGPYSEATQAYGQLSTWAKEHGYAITGPAGQHTYSNPQGTPEEDLVSMVWFPVAKVD